MRWFLNLLKSVWNWLTSIPNKIKNIFSSSTSHNTRTQEQSQQEDITVINKLPDNLKSEINELSNDVKLLILKDESILEAVKKYPKFSAILIKKNTHSVNNYNELIKPLFSNQRVLELFEKDDKLRNIFNSEEILLHSQFISLLEHLASRDETMLNRIKNHSKLATAILNKKNYSFRVSGVELFDILFAQDQEDILQKLEHDLDFTINVLTVPRRSMINYRIEPSELEHLVHIMSCLKDKEDIELLKPILQCDRSRDEWHSISHNTDIPENKKEHARQTPMQNHFTVGKMVVIDQDHGPSTNLLEDKKLSKQLAKKFFEYLYSDLSIYKVAINLNDKAIDLSVKIDIREDGKPEGIEYDKNSNRYVVYLQQGYNSDDIDTIIDKVLNKHFERIEGIVKERSPNYLKEELSNHMPSNGASPENVSTSVNESHDLSSIRLSQVDKSLNRS